LTEAELAEQQKLRALLASALSGAHHPKENNNAE